MNYISDKVAYDFAFVIKNYIPCSRKVLLIHRRYGKITCIFPQRHQAELLTIGSLVFCSVQKSNQVYIFLDLQIEYAPQTVSIHQLQFFHDIMKLCMHHVPRDIAVSELCDYLLYVYSNIENLSDKGASIVLLRLFLMFDLLPEQHEIYAAATQNPYGSIDQERAVLDRAVALSWDNFYQSENL